MRTRCDVNFQSMWTRCDVNFQSTWTLCIAMTSEPKLAYGVQLTVGKIGVTTRARNKRLRLIGQLDVVDLGRRIKHMVDNVDHALPNPERAKMSQHSRCQAKIFEAAAVVSGLTLVMLLSGPVTFATSFRTMLPPEVLTPMYWYVEVWIRVSVALKDVDFSSVLGT